MAACPNSFVCSLEGKFVRIGSPLFGMGAARASAETAGGQADRRWEPPFAIYLVKVDVTRRVSRNVLGEAGRSGGGETAVAWIELPPAAKVEMLGCAAAKRGRDRR